MPIELPVVLIEQEEAWRAVFEIYSNRPHGWIMVGGQSVYLHAIERGAPFIRPTKPELVSLVPEGAPGLERLRMSLS